MADFAVRVDHLDVVRGGNHILHDISLDVPTGRILGLLGPSGCGKTTFMRAVVGVQRITAGTVEVLGQAAGSPSLRSRVGYVTQAPSVYEDLTVAENLSYFAKVLGAGRGRVDDVVDLVDLREVADREVHHLSGGQRGRVSLGTALLGAPDLLVLDEPTVGLDPVLRHDLWELFDRLAADGATLLVSSHVMDEAERCHELLLLRDGRVLAIGSPEGLKDRTGTDDIERAFLALVAQAAAPSARDPEGAS